MATSGGSGGFPVLGSDSVTAYCARVLSEFT
jgi:hypothetical protein